MSLTDGKLYESQELPTIIFGPNKPLSYVLNPKAACTLCLHFVFFANHNYRYFDIARIHTSPTALFRIRGSELDPQIINTYYRLSPESFTFVRDPLRRFVSFFFEKIFLGGDPDFLPIRDTLTSVHGIDLSPEANLAQSCLNFAKLVASTVDQKSTDPHLRPQYINLAVGGRFTVDTILRLDDHGSLLAFFSKWIGAEKAKWFLSLQFNVQKYASDEIITDELKDLIRSIYAQDYKLFYE
jgi:hypothetical protein